MKALSIAGVCGILLYWSGAIERVADSIAVTVSAPAHNDDQTEAETVVAHRLIPAEQHFYEAGDRNSDKLAAPEKSATEAFHDMLEALHRSQLAIQRIPGYTARVEHQARIDDVLMQPEMMDLKLRREPFSVYLQWHHDRQEALYVSGENDNRMLVRPTRGLVALRGSWRLRPDSPQAMRGRRYPITEVGIEKLTEQTLAFHRHRDNSPEGLFCSQYESDLDGKPMRTFEVVFDSPDICEDYARSVLKFDPETHLLLAVTNYCWTEDGSEPGDDLLEHYAYHDVRPAEFSATEFDSGNPNYSFVNE